MNEKLRKALLQGELGKLTVSYQEVLGLAQGFLKKLGHGRLKAFVEEVEKENEGERGMNYQALITLRNNKAKRPAPLIVQRILRDGMGLETEYHREDDQYVYQFKDKEQAGAFDALKKLYVEQPPTEPTE
ncbi:hypothetical protein ACFPAF_16905 [Hymenobacter endophyticus]|uniref:Uncharacterized protein n=1 Tax=Hymenobacter endophyticus TaxID=3076335 RepID=A0ABU3TL29_9BACT|nr:hypothetical protein [Hymenobacter endophyticus]MDU0372084.1 hypothetical protein [Hymenobacter endophyticus]